MENHHLPLHHHRCLSFLDAQLTLLDIQSSSSSQPVETKQVCECMFASVAEFLILIASVFVTEGSSKLTHRGPGHGE